jgi:sec-independent protein translocase protein TatA
MIGIVGPIGTQELIIVLVIALVIFGPKRLPELGRSLGKGIKEFKKSTNELTEHITAEDESEPTTEKAAPVETASESKPVNAEAQSPKTETS